ncbi:MAG: nitroreductase family protein [Deltaproteobacteria bacterium]|nr:nitroreductase family protein [Deltaproteobacteria bacterium]
MSNIETMQRRRSCRTYDPRPVEPEKLAELRDFLLSNHTGPFNGRLRFQLLAFDEMPAEETRFLGTYGVIRGARCFILGAVGRGPQAMEDYGYAMERNILKATELGLGTCWLGGTFRRSGFAKRFNLSEDELLPAITPVGYPGERRSATERFFRFSAGSDQRKAWDELFYDRDAATPLSRESAGPCAKALECVRIGPSASNKQPWRIVRTEGAFHFYLCKTPLYDTFFKDIPLQNIDMGIAMCHFELASLEIGQAGAWTVAPTIPPEDWEYIASWVARR